ncbi:MAG: competence/damage-inducible protein A [Elusimicrobiota bacterium]|jgi:nicotinamide-nucleotide amidase
MKGRPRAALVCVGTELLSGKVNTHASWLSTRLRAAGFDVRWEATVSDRLEDVRDAVAAAVARSEAVLVCGGLGPTFDDLTREGVAAALGRRLVYRPELYARIRSKYLRFHMRVPAANRRQAWLVAGARALANERGSAPGQLLELPKASIALLPGPGSELKPMFEEAVLPALRRRFGRGAARSTAILRFCGVAESAADEKLGALLRRPPSWAEFTILAAPSLVELHIAASAPDARRALARREALERRVLARLRPYYYARDAETLESALGERLRALGWRLGAAESCTGGLLSKRLTEVSGSSSYYLGTVVAYDDRVKTALLGVPRVVLRRSGAVSAPCARAMAEGARARLGADAAVSLTGVAGPTGGTPGKPVGLVYIGLALPGRTLVRRFLFPGSREQVRERSTTNALWWLYRMLPKVIR